MIDDAKFLNKIIELYKLIYINDPILLIDNQGIILFAGSKIQEITNIEVKNLIGKNHISTLPLPQENINNISISIKKVLATKITQEFLSINLNHNPEYLILDCIIKPIINHCSSNIVAISVESKKLSTKVYLYKLLLFIENNQFNLDNLNQTLNHDYRLKHNDKLLTLREHEIAFLLFYYKSTKKIATILSNLYNKPITAKTISNIISEKLYFKFKVYGIDALIDKLQSLEYHNKIPVSFLINIHLDLS